VKHLFQSVGNFQLINYLIKLHEQMDIASLNNILNLYDRIIIWEVI